MSDWTVCAVSQNDNIINGLHHTKARQILSTTRQDHIVETSGALYLENATRWPRRSVPWQAYAPTATASTC